MKREDVKELFPDATEEQVDNILNKFGEELNPLKKQLRDAESERDEAQSALATSQVDAANFKNQLDEANAKIEEGMTAEERIAAREKAADDREREFNLKSNGLDAKEIFVQAGCFEEDEIAELVEQVTSNDNEQTKARAQRIVDTVTKQREAVAKETKAALLRENPTLGDGDGAGSVGLPKNMKEFLALDYTEQLAIKEANPDILSQLK